MLSARNEEKDQLYEQMELLKQDVLALEGELQSKEQELHNRREGSPETVQALEEEVNSYRDKLTSATLDLERRDKEIEELNNELQTREEEHEAELAKVADEWRDALDEARREKDHLADVSRLLLQLASVLSMISNAHINTGFASTSKTQILDQRENEIRELDKKLDEMDALAQEDSDRLQSALKAAASKETEVMNLGEEVMGLTDDLQKVCTSYVFRFSFPLQY